MIWLSDGSKLFSNKIISVDDEKLKQIITKNSKEEKNSNYNYGVAEETQAPKEQLVKTILSKKFNRQKRYGHWKLLKPHLIKNTMKHLIYVIYLKITNTT